MKTYSSIETNIIKKKSDLGWDIASKIPDWAIYFEWVVSTGDKNRNWYTIDSKAWFFENWKYIDKFLKSWSVLFSHEDDKPIWRPLTFEKKGDSIKVSWYVFDDTFTNGAIGRWLILWLSTGHITHNAVYRNTKDWTEIDANDFSKMIWRDEDLEDEYRNWLWEYVVTQAEIVEFSFVTTPSNRDSILNGAEVLTNLISKNLNVDPKEVKNNLFSNSKTMKLEEALKEVETLKTSVETFEKTVSENETKINALEEDLASKDKELEETKTATEEATAEVNSLKEEIATNEATILKLKDQAKEVILANAKIDWADENKMGSIADFTAKYSK